MSDPIVILDPGHGGRDPGALGPNGTREADIALIVATKVQQRLEPHVQVAMTREGDHYVSLIDRARFANRFAGAVFLSIHCNSATSPARGHEVWTSPGQTRSDQLATALFDRYCQQIPDIPARKETGDGDADKEARFTVLTATNGPAALYELEFIHTEAGEEMLTNPASQEAMAVALATGMLDYLGIATGDQPDTSGRDPQLLSQIAFHARSILDLIS